MLITNFTEVVNQLPFPSFFPSVIECTLQIKKNDEQKNNNIST